MVAHLSPKQPSSDRTSMATSTSSQAPQPMDVQSAGPPPFLNKTYEMVDDPSTDAIVSWNHGGNGFVVWNSNELQKQLLPKYFKHNNFSSFVRQLNTYGFRKVDPDRWEFANEGFLKGQKHLLKGIHRRKPSTQQQQAQQAQAQPAKPACVEVGKFGIEGEIERLKRDKNVLMSELVRLRHHQQQTDQELSMVLQRLHVTEQRQQQMISFLAKAMQSPSFLAQLVQQNENKKRFATGRKKRRLPKQDGEADAGVDEGPSSPNEGQIVKYQPNSSDPMSIFMQYMNSPEMSAKVDLPNLEVTFRDLDPKQDGFTMHSARVMGDLSPSRLMNDFSDSISGESDMQVMRFENIDGVDTASGSEGAAAASGEVRDGEVNPTPEDLLEWDQILGASDIDFDGEASNQWWDENGDHVDELAQQMRQL